VQWILNPEGLCRPGGVAEGAFAGQCRHGGGRRSYDYELQLALVAQNRGLSLVPEHILTRSRPRSHLRELRIPGLDFPLTICTVRRQSIMGFDTVIAELSRVLPCSMLRY